MIEILDFLQMLDAMMPHEEEKKKCECRNKHPQIVDVIFSGPATVVKWSDGTKTIVKCGEDDTFDKEKGIAFAIAKKYFGNADGYYKNIRKWIDKGEGQVKKTSNSDRHQEVKIDLRTIDIEELKKVLGLPF